MSLGMVPLGVCWFADCPNREVVVQCMSAQSGQRSVAWPQEVIECINQIVRPFIDNLKNWLDILIAFEFKRVHVGKKITGDNRLSTSLYRKSQTTMSETTEPAKLLCGCVKHSKSNKIAHYDGDDTIILVSQDGAAIVARRDRLRYHSWA
jgi:hypothetical protein